MLYTAPLLHFALYVSVKGVHPWHGTGRGQEMLQRKTTKRQTLSVRVSGSSGWVINSR